MDMDLDELWLWLQQAQTIENEIAEAVRQ
jgi:hypothetical protein